MTAQIDPIDVPWLVIAEQVAAQLLLDAVSQQKPPASARTRPGP
jgi:hypothetical protein